MAERSHRNRPTPSAGFDPIPDVDALCDFSAYNLDEMSIDPADLDAVAAVYCVLADYAAHKAEAMRARLAGRIADAVALEAHLETLYHVLPMYTRW